MKIVRTAPEHRALPAYSALRRAWPEFLLHDPLSNEHWHRLFDEFGEFQFVAIEDGELLAEGCSIPVAGMPHAWRQAFLTDGEPDRLCAIQVLVALDYQGRGLARPMLEHMRALARERGWELVAPVRPTWKERYPLAPIERYATWRRGDGLLYDPWLRAHERLGADVIGTADEAMQIPGTIAEWREWTGMVFPDSGAYVVPGALVPVEIDVEHDHGLYTEPCVWMRH
jgi:GNAT superfamily N-acetyltransferase